MFNSILQATVMEVKVIEGHGTTSPGASLSSSTNLH
jgi:hypothetical protein